jgi:peptidoglycan/LPS O-acetylase OafA/YrhL
MYPPIVAAGIIICVMETFPPMHTFFSGPISKWLGEFSFPIYLVHVLIICSFGSTIYLNYGTMPAIISVLAITPIAALPLVVWNRKWVGIVNRIVDGVFARLASRREAQVPNPH